MNAPINQHHESAGNKVAFLFGAVFNLLLTIDYVSHIDYAVRMLIGGLLWILFKQLSDWLARRNNRRPQPRRTKREKIKK